METPPPLPNLAEEHIGPPLDEDIRDELASHLPRLRIDKKLLNGVDSRVLQRALLEQDPHLQRVLQEILAKRG